MPAVWQKQIVLHGFEPLEHGTPEFTKFCECMEYPKVKDSPKNNSGLNAKTMSKTGSWMKLSLKSNPSREASSCSNKHKPEAYCEYHGTYGHSTSECKVMLAQAKCMRGMWESCLSADKTCKG